MSKDMIFLASVHVLLLLLSSSNGFVLIPAKQSRRLSSRLCISFGNNNKQQQEEEFPRDVKEAVSKCRAAVQQALQQRKSRMDVEFPVGTKFGVEKSIGGRKNKQQPTTPTRQVLDTSNRELARLFVEMFAPVGVENIAVVFGNDALGNQARKAWKGDASAACRILSLDATSKKQKKKKKPQGFAAKMEMEVGDTDSSGPFSLPPDLQVALFVAPSTPKELATIERVCNEVGQATCVILLNARLGQIQKWPTNKSQDLFLKEFVPVYSLCAAPQDVAPGCLVHRAFPNNWLVARKPKVGQPKIIAKQPHRPTSEDCKRAFDCIEVGELEKNVEGLVENVAGWFS